MTTASVIDVDYEQPTESAGAVCDTRHAWARVPPEPSPGERIALKERIRRLLRERNAVMVSHYYVDPDLQDLAEETGGMRRAIRSRWRASAATTRHRRWWCPACASWARPRRSCRPRSAC